MLVGGAVDAVWNTLSVPTGGAEHGKTAAWKAQASRLKMQLQAQSNVTDCIQLYCLRNCTLTDCSIDKHIKQFEHLHRRPPNPLDTSVQNSDCGELAYTVPIGVCLLDGFSATSLPLVLSVVKKKLRLSPGPQTHKKPHSL